MKQLVVTADDFGLSVEVNEAVRRAHREGILTCASLMIGAPAANEAVASRVGVEGVLIWQTVPESPAARVGLRSTDPRSGELGDVIVAAEGQPVARLADLTNTLDRLGVGANVNLTLMRNGQRVDVSVPIEDIGERENAPAQK